MCRRGAGWAAAVTSRPSSCRRGDWRADPGGCAQATAPLVPSFRLRLMMLGGGRGLRPFVRARPMVRVEQDLCPPRYRDPVWVAAGGMGDLYRAVDEVLDRPVAVKLLATRFAADEAVRRRFRREALAAARLSGDPNTVTIFDVGEWRGRPFIVMEFLGGGTLELVLRGGAQPPARALQWLEQAARSLDAAHALGVVHRDVKPANLLLGEDGRLRVGDFGIATAAGLDSLTLTGTVLGTAGYLAPEQAQGRPVTAATDGYALAVVAFELLTGKRPFERDSPTAEATAHAYEPVPSAARRNPGFPKPSTRCSQPHSPRTRRRGTGAAPRSSPPCARPAAAGTAPSRSGLRRRPDPPTRIIRPRRRLRPAVVAGAALVLLCAAGLAGALLTVGSSPRPQAASTTTLIRTTTVTAPPTTSTASPPPAPGA